MGGPQHANLQRNQFENLDPVTMAKASALHDKLESLSNLIKRRSSLEFGHMSSEENIIVEKVRGPRRETSEGGSHHACGEKLNKVYKLAEHNSQIESDAGRRLEILLDKFVSESAEDKISTTGAKATEKRKGLSRIEVLRGERRNSRVQALRAKLLNNGKDNPTRWIDSIRFCIKSGNPTLHCKDEFPIPLSKSEMNPHLLLSLSCEMLALDKGNRLLKVILLHEMSQELFVLMYWFIHCRFFQVNSFVEQRHLLRKVSNIYPRFIKMLGELVPPNQQDNISRIYPFAFSKAIFLGFKYLFPSNHNLFKGAFQRILNLSIFRLFTGLDNCPGSISALHEQFYPNDAREEEPHDSRSTKAKEPQLTHQRERRAHNARPPRSHDHSIRELATNQGTGPKIVKLDAYQISPLLRQCLGRESLSNGRHHFITRTEPNTNKNEPYTISSIETKDTNVANYKVNVHKLRKELIRTRFENKKKVNSIAKDREEILNGGKVKINNFVALMLA